MKKFTLIMAMAIISVFSHAQTKLFTIEDAAGLNRTLYPKRLSQLQWCGDSPRFAHVTGNYLLSETVKTGMQDTILDLINLNEKLKGHQVDTLKRFPSVTFSNPNVLWFNYG
ncbi:MAG: hypothetical protein HQ542_07615, partial [Bacteroidia bacterium]|nr:hypothetical protein [Bacteroidia bacterium]